MQRHYLTNSSGNLVVIQYSTLSSSLSVCIFSLPKNELTETFIIRHNLSSVPVSCMFSLSSPKIAYIQGVIHPTKISRLRFNNFLGANDDHCAISYHARTWHYRIFADFFLKSKLQDDGERWQDCLCRLALVLCQLIL